MKRGPYNPCPAPSQAQLDLIKALWLGDNDETQATIAERVGLPKWRVGVLCRQYGWGRNPSARARDLRRRLRAALKAAGIDRALEETPRPLADWPPHRFTNDPRAEAECRQGTGERRAA